MLGNEQQLIHSKDDFQTILQRALNCIKSFFLISREQDVGFRRKCCCRRQSQAFQWSRNWKKCQTHYWYARWEIDFDKVVSKVQLFRGIRFLETPTLLMKNQSGSLLITVIGPMMGLKQRRMDIQRPQTRIKPIRRDFVLSITTILYRVEIIKSYF